MLSNTVVTEYSSKVLVYIMTHGNKEPVRSHLATPGGSVPAKHPLPPLGFAWPPKLALIMQDNN